MPWDESAYQKVRCTSDTPFIRMSQNQQKTVDITVRDETGEAVDLSQFEGTNPSPGYAYETPAWMSSSSLTITDYSSSSIIPATLDVRLAASFSLASSAVEFEIDAIIIDAEAGQVRLEFTPTETCKAGIFVASLGVFWDDILRHQQMVYLEFMPNNFTLQGGGPLTVPEVRLDVADACPEANYLLDDLEFTDVEILHCMRKAVDTFNETPPRVIQYNTNNFPFRAAWLGATGAFLLEMIWHRYARNVMEYSAAGVTVRDQRYQADTYLKKAKNDIAEYKDWAQNIQIAKNISLAYGSIAPSPYARGYYGLSRN